MKNVKRMIAGVLVLAMLASFSACHKKGEIAVTVGDVEFTSAYYMCALINANLEARSKVDEQLAAEQADAEETDAADTSTDEVDYYSQKIDDKSFVTWVEDTAMDYLKKMGAYKTLCKENDLEVAEEDRANAEMYASYYWSYGYSAYFEPNGVSQDTYTQYMIDAYYANLYFDFLYGADGEKAIAEKTVAKTMTDNFVIADTIEVSYPTEDTTDENGETAKTVADQTADLKAELKEYAAALADGTKTFEEVYKVYNTEEETETETEDKQEDEEENAQPQDARATLMGAEDTGYESEYYDTVKAMKTGEVKTVEKEDGTGITLLLKQDITADPYYQKTLDTTVRHLIADDEYDKLIEEKIKTLDVSVNNYAVKQFKVKKIKEPSAE